MAKCKGLLSSITDTSSEQKIKTRIGIWGGQWGWPHGTRCCWKEIGEGQILETGVCALLVVCSNVPGVISAPRPLLGAEKVLNKYFSNEWNINKAPLTDLSLNNCSKPQRGLGLALVHPAEKPSAILECWTWTHSITQLKPPWGRHITLL